jgi:hypothetical protein
MTPIVNTSHAETGAVRALPKSIGTPRLSLVEEGLNGPHGAIAVNVQPG